MSRLWIGLFGVAMTAGAAVHPATSAPQTVVATVGSSNIVQSELDARAADMEQSYRQRLGRDLTVPQRQSIRRQALEIIVRQRLFRLDASRAQVSDAEVEAYLERMPIFNPGGVFSQSAFDNARRNDPATFRRASDDARADLGSQRIGEELRRRHTPSDDALRRASQRALETVDLDCLALPRSVFSGHYPEPAERDVVAEFRSRLHEFDVSAEASVHALMIDARPGEEAGQSRVRARADSVLAALRGGEPMTEVADRFRGVERHMTLRDDNLPGSWRGSPTLNERIFHAARGELIDAPVPTTRGFYVVQVDCGAPRRTATLAEAAPAIRERLRSVLREKIDTRDLMTLYESARDSLGRPGYKLRCAVVDGSRMPLAEPSQSDLETFYRSRLADYSRFDPTTQALVIKPLSEVRPALIERWKASRRDLYARDIANRIEDAWGQGRRDRTLEAQAKIYEPGAVPYGGDLDLGSASGAVNDTLSRRVYDRLLEVMPCGGGYAVVHAYELVERVVPSLDQVRKPLLERLRSELEAAEISQARAIYESNPERFLQGDVVYYTKLWCPQPSLLDVPMTKQELQSFYREHLADYASPERFRLRQILVSVTGTSPDADSKAQERARDLVRRIRGGEDFADLAKRVSDDDLTRDDGGDLGYRSAGEVAPELQKAAFALQVGQVSDPVRSTKGWHILQLVEHQPEQAEPLAWVYTAVGADFALRKAQAIARALGDSLAQVIGSPAQGFAVSEKLHLRTEQFRHRPGDRAYSADLIRMAERLDRMKPGEVYPGSEFFLGQGAAVMWVDSIAPPRLRAWELAQTPVLLEYRRRASQAAIQAKQAELDSLLRTGWSFDSVAALWGGARREPRYTRRTGLQGVGATTPIDSLAFGTAASPALQSGEVSGWLELADFAMRLRLNSRRSPSPAEIDNEIGQLRGIELEYALQDELKAMRQRHPVRILDPVLRGITLPPLPPRPEL